MNSLRVLSYNIHKGFSAAGLEFVLAGIKKSIELVDADIVCLQEVVGHHERHRGRLSDWPTTSQLEYLADKAWPHFAYGRNAVYTEGHHGNAILSRFPIARWENVDISTNQLERRGLLHAEVEAPSVLGARAGRLHVICVHLGLFEAGRRVQLGHIGERIERMVPHAEPLVVAGDFNDWSERASRSLEKRTGLREAFLELQGEHPRTFPSWLPVLRLDRIYYRGLEPVRAERLSTVPWNELSDHVAICAELRKGGD